VSIKQDYKVLSIPKDQTYDWLLNKHYAKRIPSISYAFGLYEHNNLVGVCTYGIPASHSLCIGVCGVENKDIVIELNRVVLENNYKNLGSYLISNSIKILPSPLVIVSYADTKMNHIGYIYQATNWIYTGATKERTDMASENGKHSRHNKGIKTERQFRSSKHRYVYFHGNKTEVKKLKNSLNYPILPYPKGDNKRYNADYKPVTQKILF
jgi:hypothetical protein